MMYREGGPDLIWGRPLTTRIVRNLEQETAATDAGWMLRPDQGPLDHDGDGHKGGSRPRKDSR